jgi:hypothetical protein
MTSRLMTHHRGFFLSALMLAAIGMEAAQRSGGWLDVPLTNWNTPGAPVPPAPAVQEAKQAVVGRCRLVPPAATAGERALDSAGWIPFWNFDQEIHREGVEIVGGMSGADGMCRPTVYNLFVFVDGRFAGTLSPALMTSRLDASSGAVRLAPDAITAEFARYASEDPLCCPSSRVTVRYRLDRTGLGPVVIPVEARTTRP